MLVVIAFLSLSLAASWLLITYHFNTGQPSPQINSIVKIKAPYAEKSARRSHDNEPSEESLGSIEPLTDLDWKATEPVKFRPFKPKYHLTMALEHVTISSMIEIDRNYLDRINLRKELMQKHMDQIIGHTEPAKQSIDELYSWMAATFLPARFPTIFSRTINPTTGKTELFNKITLDYTPLQPASSLEETLRNLAVMVEEDFMFLLPAEDGDGYELKAFVVCFPNSFNPGSILDFKLRAIHAPVPGYKEKLERSMDRWFDRLEVGKVARRVNWAVTPYDKLFTPGGHHQTDRNAQRAVDLDIEKTYVRSERQILFRLPQSRAIILAVKQYLYRIGDIKEEGLGPVLAEAIDGLKGGSVPQIHYYKRAEEWGESLKAYLLS